MTKLAISLLRFSFAIGLVATLSLSAQDREGFEARRDDQGAQCVVYLEHPERLEAVQWTGKCDAEGKANGPGTLSLFFAKVHESDTAMGNTGMVMEHGYMRAQLPVDESIQMHMDSCGLVKVKVKSYVLLQRDDVAQRILQEATHLSKQRCPTDGVSVCIYYEGHEPDFGILPYWTGCPVFWQLQRNDRSFNFEGYQNLPASDEKQRISKLQASILAERWERRKQAAATKASADQQASREAAQQRRVAFASAKGVTEFPSVDALKANPFRFQGKGIGIVQSFSSMLAANRALMEDVVVDDVPTGLFKGRETVLLAMRVLGNIPVKTALGGEVLVPHGKYLGSLVCKSSSCEELGMR